MTTWSEDNFGNEGAQAYLEMETARLLSTIQEVLDDPERRSLDEDGESLLMPSVELLALVCERYGVEPPLPVTVREWHTLYLDVFDAEAGKMKWKPAQRTARRKVIENTFRWLEGLAEGYHGE
jgi:hypothetical protein